MSYDSLAKPEIHLFCLYVRKDLQKNVTEWVSLFYKSVIPAVPLDKEGIIVTILLK